MHRRSLLQGILAFCGLGAAKAATWIDIAENWLTDCPVADLNGDGIVNFEDYALSDYEVNMADYILYIDKDSATAGTTWEQIQVASTPAATIGAALTLAYANTAASDVIDIVIKEATTAYAEQIALTNAAVADRTWRFIGDGMPVLYQNAAGNINIDKAADALVFNNIDIVNEYAFASTYIIQQTGGAPDVTFKNCSIIDNGIHPTHLFLFTPVNGENMAISFEGCDITKRKGLIYFGANFGSLTIDDCEIKKHGTSFIASNIAVAGNTVECDKIVITNSNIDVWRDVFSTYNSVGVEFARINRVVFGNNEIQSGTTSVWLRDNFGSAIIDNNIIVSSSASLIVGADTDPFTGTPGRVVCTNNRMTSIGVTGHTLALLDGAYGGYYANNTFLGGDYCGVIKGQYNTLIYNVFKGKHPMYFVGTYDGDLSLGNMVYGCTIIGQADGQTYNSAVRFMPTAKDNVVTNCIVYAGDAPYAISDGNGNAHGNNFFDYNCYYGGTVNTFRLNTQEGTTISSMLAAWITNWSDAATLGLPTENDKNSIIADPLFVDLANNDFRLQSSSPCRDAGQLTYNGETTTIGAWQPAAGGSVDKFGLAGDKFGL